MDRGDESARRRRRIDRAHEPVIAKPFESLGEGADEHVKRKPLVPFDQPLSAETGVRQDVEQRGHERAEILCEAIPDAHEVGPGAPGWIRASAAFFRIKSLMLTST